jgi:hypothetical protein
MRSRTEWLAPGTVVQENVLICRVPRVWVGRSGWQLVMVAGRTCPREGIGAAQCVRQPVPAGHPPDQVRCVGRGHPGGGDEQRACRGSAQDRHRVGSRAEPGLGHPDHRDVELGVRTRAQAGPPVFMSFRMPEPAPGVGTMFLVSARTGPGKRSSRSRSVIGLRRARARVTAVMYWNNFFGTVRSRRAERHFLWRWQSSGECAAKFSRPEL